MLRKRLKAQVFNQLARQMQREIVQDDIKPITHDGYDETLLPNLEFFYVNGNQIIGTVPVGFTKMRKLNSWDFSGNSISLGSHWASLRHNEENGMDFQ